MQHALHIPDLRALLVPLLACAIGAAGATITYAAVDGAVFDGNGVSPNVATGKHAGHAGVSAGALEAEPPAPAPVAAAVHAPVSVVAPPHKGGGPPAELSPAQEAAIAARTDPHGPAAAGR